VEEAENGGGGVIRDHGSIVGTESGQGNA
jgi:hypothetical protein